MIKVQVYKLARYKNISINICENENGEKEVTIYKQSPFSNKLNKLAVDILEKSA